MRTQKKKRRIGNKIKLSNPVRISLILLSIIIIAISSGNLLMAFNKKTQVITESSVLYKYDNKFSSDAKINLKENSYVNQDEMVDGQTYLSDLISNIKMNINYDYVATMTSKITYNYKIEAIMKATYTNTKSSYDVLNKVDTIKEDKGTTDNVSQFSINENFDIDYEKYHQSMKEFRQTMGITTDSQLYIRFTIETTTMINSKEVKNEYVANYKISIGDKVAVIEDKKDDTVSKSVKAEERTTQKVEVDYQQAIISSIFVIVGLLGLRFTLKKTEELKTIRNEFKLELNRILKSYEDKIVEIQDLKNIEIDKATHVKDIIQLRKLAEEALVPIYCYIKDDEAYFIVTKYENSYVYVLK